MACGSRCWFTAARSPTWWGPPLTRRTRCLGHFTRLVRGRPVLSGSGSGPADHGCLLNSAPSKASCSRMAQRHVPDKFLVGFSFAGEQDPVGASYRHTR